MIFSTWRVIGFGLAGILVLGTVVVFTDRDQWQSTDPQTGQHIASLEERLAQAQRTGDAQRALAILESLTPQNAQITASIAKLRREWEAPTLPSAPVAGSAWETMGLEDRLETVLLDAPSESEFYLFFTPKVAALSEPTLEKNVDAVAAACFAKGWDANQATRLMETYGLAGRPKAALRWALRAFKSGVTSPEVLDRLLQGLADRGAYELGLELISERQGASTASYQWQARFAAWTAKPHQEALALEQLVQLGKGSKEDRSRLIDLYLVAGEPASALPHVEALVAEEPTPALRELGVRLALEAGDVDRALGYVRTAMQTESDSEAWADRELQILQQDLRIAELRHVLEARYAADPVRYAAPLEKVLRKLNDYEEIFKLRLREFQTSGGDATKQAEILGMAQSLGRYDVLAETLLAAVESDPLQLISDGRLSMLRRFEVPDWHARLVASLQQQPAHEAKASAALRALAALPADPQLRAAVFAPFASRPLSQDMRGAYLDLLVREDRKLALPFLESQVLANPRDTGALRDWAEVAGWFGYAETEIAARQRFAAVEPSDTNNQFALGEALYKARGVRAAKEHWIGFAAIMPIASAPPKVQRAALQCLLDAGEREIASAWSQTLLEQPHLDPAVAEVAAVGLGALGSNQAAESAWRDVLQKSPDQPLALFALARILMDLGRSQEAAALFERLQGTPTGHTPEARFLYAEALRQNGQNEAAAPIYHELAQSNDAKVPATLRARSLIRLGFSDAGLEALRVRAESSPTQADLWLELATECSAAGRHLEAIELGQVLRRLQPKDPRIEVLLGQAYLNLRQLDAAERALFQARDLGGAPGPLALWLSEVQQASARPRSAARSLAMHLKLTQNPAPNAPMNLQALRDESTALLAPYLRGSETGNDRMRFEALVASFLFERQSQRLWIAAAQSSYRGEYVGQSGVVLPESSEFAQGYVTLTTERLGGDRYALGAHIFPAAPGSDDGAGSVSLWGRYQWGAQDDKTRTHLRVQLEDLWTTPSGAVALGGRETSLEGGYAHQLSSKSWVAFQAHVGEPSIRLDGARIQDTLVRGSLVYGRTLLGSRTAMADPVGWPRLESLAAGPYLAGPEGHQHLGWWLGLEGQKLLKDAELAERLPIAPEAKYALLGVRYDRRLVRGLGAMLGGTLAQELDQNDTSQTLEGGFTWRPRYGVELLARASVGQALGRGSNETERQFLFGFHLRL